MFIISNSRKFGDLSFHTAKGKPVILHPLASREFEVDDLNVGLLRVMVGKGSHYKVRADSEEAENMIKLAQERKVKSSSPIVHGSTEPRAPDFISVRDMKNTKRREKEQTDGDKRVFIKEEQTPSTPKQPDPPPAPEPSPLEKLIATATDLPFTEFRTQAKELLGDDFPTGNPGRPVLIEALKAKLAQPALALQE